MITFTETTKFLDAEEIRKHTRMWEYDTASKKIRLISYNPNGGFNKVERKLDYEGPITINWFVNSELDSKIGRCASLNGPENWKSRVNGDWDRPLHDGDIVNLVPAVGAFWMIAYFVVMAVMMLYSIYLLATMKGGDNTGASSTYSLSSMQNEQRSGQPIERQYGRLKRYPAYAAKPYTIYENNKMWLYAAFCLGQGKFDIEKYGFEDTNASDFHDVTFSIIQPNGSPSLFDNNILTSSEVAGGLELIAYNEGKNAGSVGAWQDAGYTGPNGWMSWNTPYGSEDGWTNWYNANATGTKSTKLFLDFEFPNGLVHRQQDGDFENYSVNWEIQYRTVVENTDGSLTYGSPVTVSYTLKKATATALRYTKTIDVTSGSYQVRARRTSKRHNGQRTSETIMWTALRAKLPNVTTFGNVTCVMMKALAQNGLTDSAARRFYFKGTAYNYVYNNTTKVWTYQADRNPVWAACDLMRATYGGGYGDEYLDLDNLSTWATWCDENEQYFDYCFDSKSDIYSQIAVCLRVIRSVPVFPLNKLRLIRDESVEIPTLIFTKENIINDSFQLQYKAATDDDYDGYKVSYTDETTDDTETVTCILDGYSGVKLKNVTIPGITNRERAYQQGMYELSVELENRASISFDTNINGWTGLPGDVAYVNYPMFGGNTSGRIKAVSGTTIQLDCNVNLSSTYPNIMKIRNPIDGSILGTYTVKYSESGNYSMLELCSAPDTSDMVFSDPQSLPIFILGVENSLAKKVRIASAQKKSEGMSFEVYIDTDARFSYDSSRPNTDLPNTSDENSSINGDSILDFDSTYGIDGPKLFAWDSSGNKYVSAFDGNKIIKIDTSNVVTTFATGINGAKNITIDSSDNLYVSSSRDFIIYKIDQDATKSVFASDVGAVYSMLFDDSSNLIVSSNSNNCVYKISSDGTKTVLSSSISGASGLLFNIDKSYIYCGSMYDECVYKINVSTGDKTVFASNLGYVCSLIFDSSGNMFVSRYYTTGTDFTGIWKITSMGVVSSFANIKSAHEITIDGNDILYVSSYLDGKVYSVTQSGTLSVLATAIGGPYGISFDPAGVLWIAGYTSDSLYSIVPNYAPSVPTDVTIEAYDSNSDGTPDGMIVNWTSDGVARRFIVQYSFDYGATWITTTSETTDNPYVIDSYQVGTVYARVAVIYNGTIWDYGYSGPTYMPESTLGFIYVTSDNYIDVTTDSYKYVSQGEE